MEKISFKKEYLKKKEGPNHKYAWQTIAEEISNYFGKPLYWVFHRFPEHRILDCYKYCKRESIANTQRFIAILHKGK